MTSPAGQAEVLGGGDFSREVVQRCQSRLEEKGLIPSSINVALAALRKLASEAVDNRLLDPAVAAAIGHVKGAAQTGRRIGRWLTREEANLLRDSGHAEGEAIARCSGAPIGGQTSRNNFCSGVVNQSATPSRDAK